MNSLQGKRVLVTGATGFLGNRLVEKLILDEGSEVVALVRRFQAASRLARFPLKMIGGDVIDPVVVRKAAEGCDAIVHCAVSFAGTAEANRAVTVEGARNVCEAALALGTRRVVHFSTISVYGDTPPGPLNETANKEPGQDAYSASKLEAERLVQTYQQRGLPATILQPTIVYGPWSFWSTYTAQQLVSGSVALPGQGAGLCNAVYVDDVIDSVLLSLRRDTAAPGPFLISAAQPVSWKDYYLAHAIRTDRASVVDLGQQETVALTQPDSIKPSLIRRILPKGIGYRLRTTARRIPVVDRTWRAAKAKYVVPRVLPMAAHLPLLDSRTVVKIDRARADLGYEPKFDLKRGGDLIRAWLRWAGYENAPAAE